MYHALVTSFSQTVDYQAKSQTQNRRMLELEGTSVDHLFNPLLNQVHLCISPEKKTPQPLYAACSSGLTPSK